MNVLSICNLSKSFGEQKIIKNLNLSVPEGSVFGFIGQNGAGKTTTMKMVLGLLQPDEGEIRVCNEPVRFGQTKTNQYIGYLPDVPEFYNYMTAIQYLTLCGEIVGLSKKIISQKGQRLLSLVGLDGTGSDLMQQVAYSAISAQYSQALETEADNYSVDLLLKEPNGKQKALAMASALKKISTGDADSGIMQKMFGDHPDTSKRIKNVEDRVAAAGNVK